MVYVHGHEMNKTLNFKENTIGCNAICMLLRNRTFSTVKHQKQQVRRKMLKNSYSHTEFNQSTNNQQHSNKAPKLLLLLLRALSYAVFFIFNF